MTYYQKAALMLFILCSIVLMQAQQLVAQSPRAAVIVVSHDMGGSIGQRQIEIRKLRRQGKPVEIRGQCYSACIMYLGLKNVCTTPDAVFGFHGPKGVFGALSTDVFDHWSRVMSRNLRKPLQVWFMQRARHVKSGVLHVSGTTLIQMGYAQCNRSA